MKDTILRIKSLLLSWILPLTTVLLVIVILKSLYILPFISNFISLISPILGGILIAYLIDPLIESLKLKRVFSCILIYGVFILLLLCIVFMIVYPLSIEFTNIKESLPSILSYIQSLLDGTMTVSGLSENTYGILTKGGELILIQMRNFSSYLAKFATSLLSAFYISLDKNELIRVFRIEKLYLNTHISYFLTASSRLILKYIFGLCLDLLFLFSAFSIVLLFFKFPYFWIYATLLSLLNMIPILGPSIGFLLLLVVSFIYNVEHMWLILLLIWIVQQIEANYIQAFIFKKTMNILPIYTMTLIVILGYYFGIVGMILSPILAGMFQIAYKSYELSCSVLPTWEDIWD